MVQCPACQKDIPPLSSFCTFCGTRLTTSPAQQPTIAPVPGRICLYCRSIIPQGSAFCPGCGRPTALRGTMILGVVSILGGVFWTWGNLSVFFYPLSYGIPRFLDSLIWIGLLVAGIGLTQSRHPLVWWLSVTIWATILVRPLFTGITIFSIIRVTASIIAIAYLALVSRYFLIGIGTRPPPRAD